MLLDCNFVALVGVLPGGEVTVAFRSNAAILRFVLRYARTLTKQTV